MFRFAELAGFAPAWFRHGLLQMESGAAEGLRGPIKRDVQEADARVIELWEPLRAPIAPGDALRLIAGCDKRGETCRLKFNNYLNFQGFPGYSRAMTGRSVIRRGQAVWMAGAAGDEPGG